jgi:putative transposase
VLASSARHVDLRQVGVRERADLITERGTPKMIVSDNGIELTSNAVLGWSGAAGVEWHYVAPGKHT